MTRRDLIASVVGAGFSLDNEPILGESHPAALSGGPNSIADLTIRDYLCRKAARITRDSCKGMTTAEGFAKNQPTRREMWEQMTGLREMLPARSRGKVPVHVTGSLQRSGYRIDKLHYESLPGLHVTANLYVPNGIVGRAPGVLYVCGHANKQKVAYQAHARRFAQLGFVTLIAETVQLGEVTGFHHGCYREGWFDWYSRGYAPSAIEALNGMRGLDLLCQRRDVDPEKLGVTGISGGGASTWWIAASDTRIQAAAPCCGTATLEAHIVDRLIDGHCDCMWWINTAQWDLADVGALIAPRPLMIASADRDSIFTIASIRKVHDQLRPVYRAAGSPQNLSLVTYAGPHAYQEPGRTAIFSWLVKHLMDKEVPPSKIGDLDETPASLEPETELRVYAMGQPGNNRVTTIHDELLKPAPIPKMPARAERESLRKAMVAKLLSTTFSHIPVKQHPIDLKLEYAFAVGSGQGPQRAPEGQIFSYEFDEGWRLHGHFTPNPGAAAHLPIVVALRNPGDERRSAEDSLAGIAAGARVILEPPGTGDTAWGDELNWHLRRAAAWTGRTLASIRVHALLRGIQVVRALPGQEKRPIHLVARREMCVAAIFAALLDGEIAGMTLIDPPATLNSHSRPDGRGEATEMLSVLRATDLWTAAALCHRTQIDIKGAVPNGARELIAG